MRYRLMATYCGAPYQAGLGPDGTEVTLFAACPPPEELGFSCAAGHWRKQVDISDLDALWQSRPVGDYRGDPCLVLDDLGDRLHIVYLGRDAVLARQLGYWEVDREVFEVVVPRHEVTNLAEEREEIPLAAATFPPADSEPRVAEQRVAEPRVAEPRVAEPPGAGHRRAGPGRAGIERAVAEADYSAPVPDRAAAWHGSPEPDSWSAPQPGGWPPEPRDSPEPWEARTGPQRFEETGGPGGLEEPNGHRGSASPGRRNGREVRASTQSIFAELLDLASIPQTAYAVDEEVSGAICLLKTDGGFEVFSRTDDARLEERFFEDEESAYFYLFGVLAAEAIRSGRLGPLAAKGSKGAGRPGGYRNGSRVPGTPSASAGNVSKYLRSGKLPKTPSHPARVYLAGGADGPPLPKQPRRPPLSSCKQNCPAYHKSISPPFLTLRHKDCGVETPAFKPRRKRRRVCDTSVGSRILAGYDGSLVVHQQPDKGCSCQKRRSRNWRPSGTACTRGSRRSVTSAAGRSARTTAGVGSRTARARCRIIPATGRGFCGPGPLAGAAPLAGSWRPGRLRRCAGRSPGMRSSR
jgi:hypothetical protein